ncbi:MAG: glycosyltransferase [Acidobacteria bacterium]|nr:glycosyltransferase [Acidobacteriota bacterium]
MPVTAIRDAGKAAQYARRRIAFWEDYSRGIARWDRFRRGYQSRLGEIVAFAIPPGLTVLELGCGAGDLLARTRPAEGVGVDFAPSMVRLARERHPGLTFLEADVHDLDLGRRFDVIILSDLINDLWDAQRVLEVCRRHAHPGTRLLLNFYSRVWELPRRAAERLGLAARPLQQNWFAPEDVRNLLYLTGWEPIRGSREILFPFPPPLLGPLLNRMLVRFWPFSRLAMTNFFVARPEPGPPSGAEPVVSVIVPARNEEGNIPNLFARIPQMGGKTELILVEGHSSDGTRAAIEREIAARPDLGARMVVQTGKGKGDAVRAGFSQATGDVLMILDADLTVPPEALPAFYRAWRGGKGELVNGVRLVYPMEDQAMRFLNTLGNRFFSLAFTWLLGQSIKDTLCGTKAIGRRQYQLLAANRQYFGDFDPFGDFDLIFGAARFNLKIADLPVRYGERTYGETNIRRWSHGWLLVRMLALALRRLKFV